MFDFQRLEVYKKAKHFHCECKRLIEDNSFERYTVDQLGRASFSVALNIAEGSGKFSKAHRKSFFSIARASVFECVAIIDIQSDKGQISIPERDALFVLADELSRILYAMIKNLNIAERK